MNSKALKDRQIQMPPLMNLADVPYQIDNTLSQFDRCNAPFLNSKLQPLFKRELDGAAAYDYKGNRYTINHLANMLYKNDEPLFRVNPRKFVKEEIDLDNVLAYDISDSFEIKVTFDNVANKLCYDLNNLKFYSSELFYEGNIITTRVRFIENVPYVVAYYKADGDVDKILIAWLNNDHFEEVTQTATWRCQYIRQNTSASYSPIPLTNVKAYPLISIAKVNGVVGISLISQFGTVLNSTKTGFMTFFISGGNIYEYGVDLYPDTTTTSQVVTTTNQAYFNVQVGTTSYTTINSYAVYDSDEDTYYDFIGQEGLGPVIDFGSYVPINTGNTTTINGKSYPLYSYSKVRATCQINVRSQANTAWSFIVNDTTSSDSDTNTLKTINMQTETFGTNRIPISVVSVKIVWEGVTTNVPSSYFNGNSYLITVTTESTQNIGWLVYPNVVCDNGNLYSMFAFQAETGDTWSHSLTANNYIIESGRLNSTTMSGTSMIYKVDSIESVLVTSDMVNVRSNGYTVGQNWFQSVVKLNNNTAQVPKNNSIAEPDTARFIEYSNSNTYDLSYFPGTFRNSNDSYINSITDQESYVVGNPIGGRERLGNFNTLFNVLQSENAAFTQGISYSETENQMGTLITEWSSIDNDFYIAANSDTVVYKDIYGKFWKVSIVEGNDLIAVLDGKYIIVNTTSYWNFYDAEKEKKYHYASDYNNRCQAGTRTNTGAENYIDRKKARTKNTAINHAYRIAPREVIASIIFPLQTLVRCNAESETLFDCNSPEDLDVQPIDVYFSEIGKTTAYYQFSISPLAIQNNYKRYDLIGSSYVDENVGTLASPDIFTRYINGAGNNDFVKENTTNFVMQYYNNKPYFLYQLSSETDDVDAFFVIQGQFYAIINNKICSVIYSNGMLSEVDALVDLGDMKFIGNNPTIAFFWSPSQRAFYSWTGDANLAWIYAGSKFSEIEGKFWYDYTSQSIFVKTDNGLLVFGPKNTYVLEDLKNVDEVYFTNDGLTHVIDSEKTYDFSYYPREGFVSNKVVIETQFFGYAPMLSSSIDKWAITFATDEPEKKAEIKFAVSTITDCTVKSEEKKMEIKPAEWDKLSKSKLVNYNPALIKGQGIKLYIESDVSVAYIVPHISDNNYSMPTMKNI